MMILSFIPEASKNKKLPNSSLGHFLLFVFILFVSISISQMLQHHLSAPACEKPAKGKIKPTFMAQALANVTYFPVQTDNAQKLKWSAVALKPI